MRFVKPLAKGEQVNGPICLRRRQAMAGLGALVAGAAFGPKVGAYAPSPLPLALYEAIRKEGLGHSQVMAYATSLSDGIGGRLMGSPNMTRAYDWSLAHLRALGTQNARLEPIGARGLSWRPIRVWARMTVPDNTPLIAMANPWSVGTPGAIEADLVKTNLDTDEDLARAKGTLSGKFVLLGGPQASPEEGALVKRYTDEDVNSGKATEAVRNYYRTVAERRIRQGAEGLFRARRIAFLAAEGVSAVIINGAAATAGAISLDGGSLGDDRPSIPVLCLAGEGFARCWRLLEARVPVRLQFEITTEEIATPQMGYNVVAEIPGHDPKLKAQVVLAGAHLDSWGGGTGAADNGAGVAATLEAVRILQTLKLKPRRTVRVVLYGGEEQGLFGSEAYARHRLGHIPRSTSPEQMALGVEGRRAKVGPLIEGPEYDDFSIAFNLDSGSGRIRGLFTGGANPALADLLRGWIAPLKDLGVLAVYDAPDWPADQSTFTEIGLPGVSLFQDPLDYDTRAHHTNLDTLERLSSADLAQAATVLAILLIQSANTDARAPRARTT